MKKKKKKKQMEITTRVEHHPVADNIQNCARVACILSVEKNTIYKWRTRWNLRWQLTCGCSCINAMPCHAMYLSVYVIFTYIFFSWNFVSCLVCFFYFIYWNYFSFSQWGMRTTWKKIEIFDAQSIWIDWWRSFRDDSHTCCYTPTKSNTTRGHQ